MKKIGKVPNEMDYQGIGIRLAAQIVDGIIFFFIIVGYFVASKKGGLTPSGFELHGIPALISNIFGGCHLDSPFR